MNNHNRMLKALLFASAFAASAAAQDTAYVPFLVTANTESATVKAQQGEKIFLKEIAAGVEDTLHIILEGVPAFARPGIAAPSPVTMHSSRGRLSLELSPQHYRSAEISLYSLGGKRVLHGKVNASDAARSISRADIATGVYVLYVKGSGGGFSTRLSHQGGGMDIDVSFGGGVSPLRKEDIAEFGAWEITVSAEGHESFEYTLNPVIGINELQDITLTPLSSSSSGDPSSSSDDDTPSSSSDDEPSSSSDDGGDSSSSVELPKCGGTEYDPETEFCLGSAVTPLCGGKTFTASEFCLGTTVTPLCGGETFAVSEFCFDGEVIDKCGGEEYDPGTHYCHDSQAHTCGNLPHNPSTHFCYTYGEQYSCGNKPFDPDAQFCYNDSKIGEYCGTREDIYDPDLYGCKPKINANGIYLKTPLSYEGEDYEAVLIGTQTWMAENLNYAVSGSKCRNGSSLSDDNTASCDIYGRLYNWATAVALDPSCNTITCYDQVHSKHQGICPDGWHLPSDAEWTDLKIFVGSNPGTKLKAESGWNDYNGASGSGSNQYGFSALPGGYGNSSGIFYGNVGSWWSATECDANYAYGQNMGYNIAHVSRYDYNKSYLYSVRCVQN